MISERQFASSFSSAWKVLAPFSRETLAKLNRGALRYAEAVAGASERRSLVGELGFRLFARMSEGPSREALSLADAEAIHRETEEYVLGLIPEPHRAVPCRW